MSLDPDERELERLLERLASEGPEAVRRGGDPAARELARAVEEVGQGLDRLALEARADIAAADGGPAAEGEEKVAGWIHALARAEDERVAGHGPRPAPGRRGWLLGLVAAAALVLAWAIGPWRADRPEPVGPLLGGAPELHVAWAEQTCRLSWEIECPPAGHFVVRLFACEASGASSGPALLESPSLRADAWTIDPERARELPANFAWKLEVYDGSSPRPARSYWSQARRP